MKRLKSLLLFVVLILIAATTQSQEIIEATKSGALAKVRELIEANPQLVSTKDENGRTPLHWAARGVHFEVMKYLVAKGADVNASDKNGITPLTSVVARNHIEAIKFLLDNGAKTEEADNIQKAPILYALTSESKDVLDLLIKRGASLEVKDDYQRTPLLLTCRESGSFVIVKILIESGANINAVDIFGDTPLTLAAWRGFEEIVNYLLDENAEFSTSGDEGIMLLNYAADKRLWKLYQALINKGGDQFLHSLKKRPVLHWAAAGGSEKIVRDLIDKHLPVNAIDFYGWTPLHYASYFDRLEVVKLLIETGSDINAKTPLGESPFYLALTENKKDVVDLMVSLGADQNIPVMTNLSGEYLGQKKPGAYPELFAPGIISRLKGGHSNIVFSPEGTEAMWTEWNLRDVGYSAGCTMWYSKIKDGVWILPKKILPLSDTPFYSADGKKIYFLSSLPLPPENNNVRGIWYVEREGDSLSNPKYLNFDVAGTGLYWQYSFDKNGNIYFSADDGLFRSLYSDGKYLPKEKLTDIFHPDYNGMGPFISPDGTYIIFSANLPDSFGSLDLYIGYRNTDGTWTKPVNMGSAINSSSQEILPIVSGDGKYLFMRTERNGINGIYWVNAKIIEELRSKVFKTN
jgi:ankyrin repeat protein